MQQVYTALVTPFRGSELDLDAFRQLCEHQFRAGVDVVVGGTTGESPTLSDLELLQLVEVASQLRDSQYPERSVVVGVGTNSTQSTVLRALLILNSGQLKGKLDALMVVTPYYNKPNCEGLSEHYSRLVDQIWHCFTPSQRIPLMIYHVPGRTGCQIGPEDLARLCNTLNLKYPTCIASVKDAVGNPEYSRQLRVKLSRNISLFSGDDALYLETLASEARSQNESKLYDGTVSVLSNVCPRQLVAYTRDPLHSPYGAFYLSEMTRFLFSVSSPLPAKWLLSRRGQCSDTCRPPLAMGPETKAAIERLYRDIIEPLGGNEPLLADNGAMVRCNSLGNQIWLVEEHPVWFGRQRSLALYLALHPYPVDTVVTYRQVEGGGQSDYAVRFINRDGGEVEMCGNGLRCLSSYLARHDVASPKFIDKSGNVSNNHKNSAYQHLEWVNLGEPQMLATIYRFSDPKLQQLLSQVKIVTEFQAVSISVGNPHLVVFVEEPLGLELLNRLGQHLQTVTDGGTNLECVTVSGESHVALQVYERGVGVTDSCGSGCVAAVSAAHQKGLLHSSSVTVRLKRGCMTVIKSDNGYSTGATVEFE